jgi:hypothetical protein
MTRKTIPISDEDYAAMVAQMTADGVIIDIAMSLPVGFPFADLIGEGMKGELDMQFADSVNWLYDEGLLGRGDKPQKRPMGAVCDAVWMVAQEIGVAA